VYVGRGAEAIADTRSLKHNRAPYKKLQATAATYEILQALVTPSSGSSSGTTTKMITPW